MPIFNPENNEEQKFEREVYLREAIDERKNEQGVYAREAVKEEEAKKRYEDIHHHNARTPEEEKLIKDETKKEDKNLEDFFKKLKESYRMKEIITDLYHYTDNKSEKVLKHILYGLDKSMKYYRHTLLHEKVRKRREDEILGTSFGGGWRKSKRNSKKSKRKSRKR
jgi:hypothetical protein